VLKIAGNCIADLWKKYMQLTEVEAAFRTLKSELAVRPLFHQLEKGVKAQVLVAFLGYALQVTLFARAPVQDLKRLSELNSVDIVLPTVEGPAQDYQAGRRSGKATQPTPTGVGGTIGADSGPEMECRFGHSLN
jgi:hypothetical protein